MADNIDITPGTGKTISTDDRGGAHVQRVTDTLEQVRVTVTPTISAAGIYAAKDAIGALYTFTDAVAYSGGSGRVIAVVIVDKDQERADMDLVLFDSSITAPTDNAVFDPTDAELSQCLGWISIGSGAYSDFNDNSVAIIPCDLPFKLNATANLYGAMVARSTPTYTATTDLVVTLVIARD